MSECEHLQGGVFGKGPNVFDEQRFSFENYFLPDMINACELKNKKQAKVAVIELCDLDTPLDERNTYHYDLEMTGSTPFPYRKTRAGALQSKKMVWDYETHQRRWALVGGLSGLLALTAKVAKK